MNATIRTDETPGDRGQASLWGVATASILMLVLVTSCATSMRSPRSLSEIDRPPESWCSQECPGPLEGERIDPREWREDPALLRIDDLPPELQARIMEYAGAELRDDLPAIVAMLDRAQRTKTVVARIRGVLRAVDLRCFTPLMAFDEEGRGPIQVSYLGCYVHERKCKEGVWSHSWKRKHSNWVLVYDESAMGPGPSEEPLPSEQIEVK